MPGAGSKPPPKGPNGENLCRWCLKKVSPPRRTFCSPDCVHEYSLRTSTSYARRCVRLRDKGICAKCGLDTYKITKGLRKPLKGETKTQWKNRVSAIRKKYRLGPKRVTAWDMDHILAVAEGGGLCGLLGYQTLCTICHQVKSKEMMARRRESKKKKIKRRTKKAS